MKVFWNVLKVLAVLAAIAAAVYAVIAYGDKIKAWLCELKSKLCFGCSCDCDCDCDCNSDEVVEEDFAG